MDFGNYKIARAVRGNNLHPRNIESRSCAHTPRIQSHSGVRFLSKVIILAVAIASWKADRAIAADKPLQMPSEARANVDWGGLYVGAHVGYGRGQANIISHDPESVTSRSSFGALYGGLHVGYNYLLTSRLMLGVETDISFPDSPGGSDVIWSGTTAQSEIIEKIDYMGTLRGRIGYAFGNWLLYGTAGVSWSGGHFFRTDPASGNEQSRPGLRTGWTAGAGLEHSFQPNWSTRLEYLYGRLGSANVSLPSGAEYASRFDVHVLRLGLTYKLASEAGTNNPNADLPSLSESERWEIHGQTTYVQQGYPSFRAPYSGRNSLTPAAQTKNTWTTSAFLGVKLWDGGELYYNPELLQGFGLNSTVGAGGFPNGEAQKSDFLYPHYNTSRLFLRQTFGLGGEQETIRSDYGQMAGKVDVSRVTVQVGKFAVHDLFDANAYAQDPRTDFLNWSIWAAGAFDYPADKLGLTYGAAAEFNQKHWAVRAGYFLIGSEPDSNNFDMALFKRGGYVAELETRYSLFSRPGKFRMTGWFHNSFSGRYRDALNLSVSNPAFDPTDAIVASRRGNTKYGYVLNLEQSITNDIGVFARWSWNNGKNEISAFTDIDSSLSFGTSIKGAGWGRPNDRIGIAMAINGLSEDHRSYIAAGGMGILVGDGRLNYRQEKIFETFYALNLAKGTTLTFDYQFMMNPAYNADRGPISIYAARLHAEF